MQQFKYISHFVVRPQPHFIPISGGKLGLTHSQLVDDVGHKGAELTEMQEIGINTGLGFSTTGKFYDEFLELEVTIPGRADIPKQSIRKHIDSIWTHYSTKYFDSDTVDKSTIMEKIQRMCSLIGKVFDQITKTQILGVESERDPKFVALQDGLMNEILARQAASANGVAQGFFVRSSGLKMEDCGDTSAAGQNATLPNVVGGTNIMIAVIECFKSLWETRSVKYRMDNRDKGISVTDTKMATVILETVASMNNWIGFSLCNETGNRDVMKITVQWGQGEGQVSGEQGALPDIIYCSKYLLRKRQAQEAAASAGTLPAGEELVDPVVFRQKGRQTQMKASMPGSDRPDLATALNAFSTQTLPLTTDEKDAGIAFLRETMRGIRKRQPESISLLSDSEAGSAMEEQAPNSAPDLAKASRRYSTTGDEERRSPEDDEPSSFKVTYDKFSALVGSRHDLTTRTKAYLMMKSMGGGLVSQDVPEELRDKFVFTDTQLFTLFSNLLKQEEHYSTLDGHYSGRDTEGGQEFRDHAGVEALSTGTVNNLDQVWLQSRGETVHSKKDPADFKVVRVSKKPEYASRIPALEGLAAGQMAGQGKICIVRMHDKALMEHDLKKFKTGDILVGASADPDIGAVLKECHGFFVGGGGPNCHGFILARERNAGGFGMAEGPEDTKCCIGGGGNMGDGSIEITETNGLLTATFTSKSGEKITFKNGDFVTVDCSQSDGICRVYKEVSPSERIRYNEREIRKKDIPVPQMTNVGVIAGSPIEALTYQQLMHKKDVRLLRMEFVYQSMLVDRDRTPLHPVYIGEWKTHFDHLTANFAQRGMNFEALLHGYICQNMAACAEMGQLLEELNSSSVPEDKELAYEIDCYLRLAEASAGYANPEEWAVAKIRETINFYQSMFPKVSIRAFDLKKSEMNGNIGARSKVGQVGRIMSENTRDDIIGHRGSSLFLDESFQISWKKIELKAVKAAFEDGCEMETVRDPFTGEEKQEKHYRGKYFTVFNRTPQEFNIVRKMAQEAGINNIGVMCEIPENVDDIFEYYYDGTMFMSIGGNDLEMTNHGRKRDGADFETPGLVHGLSLAMIKKYVTAAFASFYMGCPISSCGNAPTDNAQLAKILTALPMDGFGIMPDKYPETCAVVCEAEQEILRLAREKHGNPELSIDQISIEDRMLALRKFLTEALKGIADEQVKQDGVPEANRKSERNKLVKLWVNEVMGIEHECRSKAIMWVNEQIRSNDPSLASTELFRPEEDISGYLSDDEAPTPVLEQPRQAPKAYGPKRLYDQLSMKELLREFPDDEPKNAYRTQVLAENLRTYNHRFRQFSPEKIEQAMPKVATTA